MTTTETLVESRHAKDLRALANLWFRGLELPEQVERLNELRGVLAEFSPFRTEPVDNVEWVPIDTVQANSYNPNSGTNSPSERTVPRDLPR